MEELNKRLLAVQTALKAPKSQKNTFGNYSYRSCEDILEALKPLLHAQDLVLHLSDDIVLVGERYYVKAKATITYKDSSYDVSAFAREEETKKGMDASQITGSASSYARKYALNGLFAIDDTKDADSQNNTKQTKPVAKPATPRAEKPEPNVIRNYEVSNLKAAARKVIGDAEDDEVVAFLEDKLNLHEHKLTLAKLPRSWVAKAQQKIEALSA